MTRCKGITALGVRCKRSVTDVSGLCFQHGKVQKKSNPKKAVKARDQKNKKAPAVTTKPKKVVPSLPPSHILDDTDFIQTSLNFLEVVLGDGFEISEDHGKVNNILIKGALSHDSFKTYFKSDYNRDDYEDLKDEEYVPYTLDYNKTGLKMYMDSFDFISKSPTAMEINRILFRARQVPGFLE